MKSYSMLTFLVVLFVHNEFRFSHAAPTSSNEILIDKNLEEKRFRETYAARVKSYMNTSVNPCDDFYEYACGNFANSIEEMDITKRRSNLLDISSNLLKKIDEMLNKTRHPSEEYYEELMKTKKYLDSCVAAKIWPIEQNEEYLKVVKSIGGFPAVDPTWNASTFDWVNMTAHLTRYGVEGIIKENIFLMYPFPPYYEISKFGFNFDVYLENIETNKSDGYVYNEKIMKDLLNAYGVSGSKADNVIEGIFDFWKEVLQVQTSIENIKICPILSIMEESMPIEFAKWQTYLNVAWNVSAFDIDATDEMSECPCPWYFNKLDGIASRKPEAIANYMALKFLFSMHTKLKSDKFQRQFCIGQVKAGMSLVLTHFYMKEYYDKDAEGDILEIIEELRTSLKNLVETTDWIDEPTRLEAMNKIKTLRPLIGEVTDPITDTYIKLLNKLNFTDNYASNQLQLAQYLVDLHHYGFLHPELSEDTSPIEVLNAIEVNAFYYVLQNTINIMAGILHPPVYHPYLPKSVKYGSLGYILGHELTHGFDSTGSNFDANLTIRNWWSDKSTKEFKERSNCFADHYSKFHIPEFNHQINGTKSQDENIADSGGLREALNAYRRVSKNAIKNKDEDFQKKETLPGLNLTPEQTFFLSFAQIYCAKYEPNHYWVEVSDEHPLDKYRVLGSLQNYEEFPLVYNCPVGSPMNPSDKCRLW